MAVKVRAKKALSTEAKVQRLAMMLGDDPSLDVSIQSVFDSKRDNGDRLEALMQIAHRSGRTVSF